MRLLLGILLVITVCYLKGQSFAVKNYNVGHGLTHSNVYRTFQDHRGFLWFCTDNGVCRFDGREFRKIEDSLTQGPVMSVSEDERKNILLSTMREGLLVHTDSSLHRYRVRKTALPDYVLNAIVWKKKIWMICHAPRKFLLAVSGDTVLEPDIRDAQGNPVRFGRMFRGEDELLLCSDNGLYRVRDQSVEPFLPDLVKGTVSDVRKDNKGVYWVSLKTRIMAIRDGNVLQSYDLEPDGAINTIFCDKDNNIWISQYGKGALLLKNGVIENVTHRLGLRMVLINDFFQDNEHNLWIGTYDAGLYKISSLDLLNYSLEDNQRNLFCRAIEPYGKNRILISTLGRLCLWEDSVIKTVPSDFLSSDDYLYFTRMHNNQLYLGTQDRLVIAEYSGGRLKFRAALGTAAISMCVDHTKRVWVGNFSRLCYIEGNKIISDTVEPLLRNKRFNVIFEDSRRYLWLGTNKGLIKSDGKRYWKVKLPGGKAFSQIAAIMEDSHRRVWVATEGGLLCYEKDSCRVFTTQNGLSHNKCRALTEDRNNTLWVGTLRGLSYMDLATLDVKRYGAGFYSDDVLSLYCNEDNILFVGTATKLSSVKNNRIFPDTSAPRVYITHFKTSQVEISMPSKVFLPYYENKFRIDFIGLCFENENAVEYRYKIKGINNNWMYTTNTSIELPVFPSGRFSFILCARKNKGEWSREVVLPILVSTPFWKSSWFIILVSLLAAAAIFLLSRWYIRKKEYEKRKQLTQENKELLLRNKVAYLRQQALGALINPHFIFNCMNSIQHYLNRNDKDKANAYLADFARLIRLTIENAQDAFIALEEELERISLYLSLEQLRFGGDLTYRIHVEEGINPKTLRIPNMILQPYIENAIWHGIMPNGGKGHITLSFTRNDPEQIRITIVDNGVGMKEAEKNQKMRRKHFGMQLTEERLRLLKQFSRQEYYVTVKKPPDGKGTMIEILAPAVPAEPDYLSGE